MCIRNYRLEIVVIDKLRPNGFNPESRVNTKSKKFKQLLESVRKNGVIEPLMVSKDYMIIAGHRRWTAARIAGLVEVPCVVTNHSAQHAWAEATFNQLGVNGRQLVEATSQGLDVAYLPPKLAANIKDLKETAGAELYGEMAANGVGVGITKSLRMVCLYVGDEDAQFRTLALRWLVKCKMQYEARKIIESDPLNEENTRGKLRYAIEKGVPLLPQTTYNVLAEQNA